MSLIQPAMTAIPLAAILGGLSALHVYWALGGRRGWAQALPQVDDRPIFTPSRLATVLVAVGLALAALVPLVRAGILAAPAPAWLSRAAAVALALVFLLRAVGDFNLVGFFKRVRGTTFARWDTRLYSPLCLLLASGFVHVALS